MSEQKIEQFWRDATADDVARVMRGETVDIRVRDDDDDDWRYGEYLGGVHRGNCEEFKWKDRDGVPWKQCQVYDPQQWWLDKPDPGEGFRLLGKFPHEDLQDGDEKWSRSHREWTMSCNAIGGSKEQSEEVWYRRRIETKPTHCVGRVCCLAQSTGVTCPHDSCDLETKVRETNNPASSDSCRSRDAIPSGWRLLGKDEERIASDAFWSLGCKEWIVLGDDRVGVANREKLHAIRQVVVADFFLLEGYDYSMPGGQTIRITAKGFEVL